MAGEDQPSPFDAAGSPDDGRPRVPLTPTVEPDDAPRLAAHHAAILARLRGGPATNAELAEAIGLRFGARLHELRRVGYAIATERQSAGLVVYRLVGEPGRAAPHHPERTPP